MSPNAPQAFEVQGRLFTKAHVSQTSDQWGIGGGTIPKHCRECGGRSAMPAAAGWRSQGRLRRGDGLRPNLDCLLERLLGGFALARVERRPPRTVGLDCAGFSRDHVASAVHRVNAQRCRQQAALTTDRAVSILLHKIAEHYDA